MAKTQWPLSVSKAVRRCRAAVSPALSGGASGCGVSGPLNHWPDPWDHAERKDQREQRTCRAVCTGEITLPAAQAIFLGDWHKAYDR
jgi:hypothetical protein